MKGGDHPKTKSKRSNPLPNKKSKIILNLIILGGKQ
jgi:hypothetical protein